MISNNQRTVWQFRLKMIFLPYFFNAMVHLTIHIAREASIVRYNIDVCMHSKDIDICS